MRALGVDWSGARDPSVQRRTIWVAEAEDGHLLGLSAGRTREEVADVVIGVAGSAEMVGLDFSFGFPAWWAEAHHAETGPDMWDVAVADGEDWLARCEPPFWGRPRRPRPDAAGPALRRTELATPPGWSRPKSIFQIGGAGQVGTGSIRGMAVLRRIRDAGLAVWPFDPVPGSGVVVVEAYPRWCTGPVVKSRGADRAAFLARMWPAVTGSLRTAAIGSEDAFDAACTALTLSRSQRPETTLDRLDRIEGLVIVPSFALRPPRVATGP
ncbi:MAG: hypothetical protein NVS1B12_16460 [Acidimicrobiales bacterium]